MARRRKASPTLLGLWAESAAVGIATMTTLAVRVPELVAGTMTPAERRRMVAEKIAAAQRGIMDAALVAGRVAMRGPRRPTAGGLMKTTVAVLDAASAPARRTVTANAKRLSKPAGGRSKRP